MHAGKIFFQDFKVSCNPVQQSNKQNKMQLCISFSNYEHVLA